MWYHKSNWKLSQEKTCGFWNKLDPKFDRKDCGPVCPPINSNFYCEAGEKCCVTGPHDDKCSTSCPPIDPDGMVNNVLCGIMIW